MPLPKNQDEANALLIRLANGNQDAARFLLHIAMLARLADDIVDGKSRDLQRDMMSILHTSLVEIPNNQFYRANTAALSMPIIEALTAWHFSDELRKSDDEKCRTFGYVLRESTDRIGTAVAYLTGGFINAMAATRDIYATCHAPHTESVEAWATEKD